MVLILNNFIGGEFVGSHVDNNNNDGKNNVIERLVLVLCFGGTLRLENVLSFEMHLQHQSSYWRSFCHFTKLHSRRR